MKSHGSLLKGVSELRPMETSDMILALSQLPQWLEIKD